MRIENEHSALSSSTRDASALFFDETTSLVESNLHALFNNSADRDQILRDSRNMQDIFNVGFLTFFAERNIVDMPNWTRCRENSRLRVGWTGPPGSLTRLDESVDLCS